MSEQIYEKLREFLDKLPGGFPETQSRVEIKILKKIYTPEQANILLNMTLAPEPASAIAKKLNMDEKEAAQKIEEMAKKGQILRIKFGEDIYYSASQFVPGVWEWQMNNMDREFAELVNEYFPYIAKQWASIKTQQLRVVPLNSAVSQASSVETYDRIRELIENKSLIAVAPCVCARDKELLDEPCKFPVERCINFDMVAQYYIDNNMGRKITKDELLDILKMGEERGLVLSVGNAKDLGFICMCCGCCCVHLRMLKMGGHPAKQAHTSYMAVIDPELCTSCGTCEERCQMNAVTEGDESFKIDTDNCIGCGVCVSTCPVEAIKLINKPDPMPVYDNMLETFQKIMAERGVA